jgi:hypothetical protein
MSELASEELVGDAFPPIDEWWPPSQADLAPLSPAELLDLAELLPADGSLCNWLLDIETNQLDQTCQVRLAQQWARVEAAASGHKLAAVGVVVEAGPEPDDPIDFRDFEVAVALTLGLNSARTVMAVASTLLTKGRRVLAAMRDGEIGYLQALQYADALRQATAEQAERIQDLTLAKAPSLTPGELRRLLRRAVARVGAEDFARKHREAKKTVHVSARYDEGGDGMGELSARMSAVDLNTVDRGVEAWARGAKASGDERSLDELRVAALVEWAERHLTGEPKPRAHGRPITVNVTVDLPTFLGLTDHPGEVLGTGAMIPAEAIRDLIPDAELRRLIIDPLTGHLLDYGRRTYRFPPDAAAFQIAKWVTSTGPGSAVPAERGDIDHGQAWEAGGQTDRDNGNPVNRRWHNAKTLGGWIVIPTDDGWTWRSKFGLEYKASPHDYRLGP